MSFEKKVVKQEGKWIQDWVAKCRICLESKVCLVFVKNLILVVFKMGLLFGLIQVALFVRLIRRKSKTYNAFLRVFN